MAHSADTCMELCIKAGFNVTKLNLSQSSSTNMSTSLNLDPKRVSPASPSSASSSASSSPPYSPQRSPVLAPTFSSSSPDDIMREASHRKCDILVVSKDSGIFLPPPFFPWSVCQFVNLLKYFASASESIILIRGIRLKGGVISLRSRNLQSSLLVAGVVGIE